MKKYHRDRIAKIAQLFDRCIAFLKRPPKEDFKTYYTPSQKMYLNNLQQYAKCFLTDGKKAKIMRSFFKANRSGWFELPLKNRVRVL